MPASNGAYGTRPYVEIAGVPFPLVEGSQLQRSPLNPFSPASQAGNSARITDARLAVEVWDNFTAGLGQRDEEGQDTNSYSEGNLDARVPGALALPPLPTNLATTSFNATSKTPVYVEYMRGGPTTTTLLLWSPTGTIIQQWRNGSLTTLTAETPKGFTAHNNAYWYIAQVGGNTKVYKTTDAGGTWTNPHTTAAKLWVGLAQVDNRMLTYNATDGTFMQSLDGATWTTHSTAFVPLPGESVVKIFSWIAPGGARDTAYVLTNLRILAYEDESLEWHEYYSFEGIFQTKYPDAYVFRRDQNVYFSPFDDVTLSAPDNNGVVMMFTPGTADEIGPAKRFGLPDGFVNGIFRLQGGAHWLYGFAYGTQGGIYALNEFQGWTMMFDPRTSGSPTASVIGGGYANGLLWAVTSDGKLYEMPAKDRRSMPPVTGGSYNSGIHYLRSSWTTHNQKNRVKIGAYFEVDFRLADGTSGLPPGSTAKLLYRVDNQGWVTLDISNPGESGMVGLILMQSVSGTNLGFPVKLKLPTNTTQTGIGYKRLQWEIQVARGGDSTVTPVPASVALYYTFWTENHYAYQFNIDLSVEGWSEFPDNTFFGYAREELVEILLSHNESTDHYHYHTFSYASGSLLLEIEAVDLLISGREDAAMGGGIYSVTVRDVEA